VTSAGPGEFSGAAELLVDDKPQSSSSQIVGPIPAGGRFPLHFRTSLAEGGSHVLAVRVTGGDSLAAGHVSAVPVQVAPAIPVLLVEGEPGVEPFTGEIDFLRAALAPSGDETPVFRIKVMSTPELSAQALSGMKVAVLANVERISPEQSAAVGNFIGAGGGILVAPGDRTEASSWRNVDWMPARVASYTGRASEGKVIAHPAPRTFSGPLMTGLGRGDAPALAEADFFAFAKLEPTAGSAVLARLDTGDPWLVERSQGRGRVLMLATAIDAEAGTLPANPDFVPLCHEWVLHLAGGGEPLLVRAGEPLIFPLEAAPGADVKSLAVETPSGTIAQAEVIRSGGLATARFEDTVESGIYRLSLPGTGPAGFMYGAVEHDERESDRSALEPPEAAKLAEGWPLEFVSDADDAALGILAGEAGGKHEVWRWLILAVLAGLCLEIYLTRRLVRVQAGAGGMD
jgi:hypothetical protein